MTDFTEEEIRRVARGLRDTSAPGPDGVNAGVWKWIISGSRKAVRFITKMFNKYKALRKWPQVGKVSAITPIWKAGKEGGGAEHTRPISLQCALTKILSVAITHRHSAILAAHPILHHGQHAFIDGGSTTRALAVLIGEIKAAHEEKRTCYVSEYDLAGAFDNVEHVALSRAMRRLSMPPSYVEWMLDSLTGLTSYIRTPYGDTDTFSVTKSVRQGDPASPLQFITYLDGLVCAIHLDSLRSTRSMTRQQGPASPTYADDVFAVADSVHEANLQGAAAHLATFLLGGKMAVEKCGFLETPLPASGHTTASLTINNITIKPVPPGDALKALGLRIDPGLSFDLERQHIRGVLFKYRNTVTNNQLDPIQAGLMYRTYVIPLLQYVLPFIPRVRETFWEECDELVRGALELSNHATGHSVGKLPHHAIESMLMAPLPSKLHASCVVAEQFMQAQQSGPEGDKAAARLLASTNLAMASLGLKAVEVTAPAISHALPASLIQKRSDNDHLYHMQNRSKTMINYPSGEPRNAIELPTYFGPDRIAFWQDRGQLVSANSLCPTPTLLAFITASNNHWCFSVFDNDHTTNHSYVRAPQSRYLHLLESLVRLLQAVPANWPVNVMAADLGALQAIVNYPKLSEQQQAKEYGRPYLNMILDCQRERDHWGAPIQFTWLQGVNEKEDEENEEPHQHSLPPTAVRDEPARSLQELRMKELHGARPTLYRTAMLHATKQPVGWPTNLLMWKRDTCDAAHKILEVIRKTLRSKEKRPKNERTQQRDPTAALNRQVAWHKARLHSHPDAGRNNRREGIPHLVLGPGERRVALVYKEDGDLPIVGNIRKFGQIKAGLDSEKVWISNERNNVNRVDGFQRLIALATKNAAKLACSGASRTLLAIAANHLATSCLTSRIASEMDSSEQCHFCKHEESVKHLFLHCGQFKRLRDKHLADIINITKTPKEDLPNIEPAILQQAKLGLAKIFKLPKRLTTMLDKPLTLQTLIDTRPRTSRLHTAAALYLTSLLIQHDHSIKSDGDLKDRFQSVQTTLTNGDEFAVPDYGQLQPNVVATLMRQLQLDVELAENPLQMWPSAAKRNGMALPPPAASAIDVSARSAILERSCGWQTNDGIKVRIDAGPCFIHPTLSPRRQHELVNDINSYATNGNTVRAVAVVVKPLTAETKAAIRRCRGWYFHSLNTTFPTCRSEQPNAAVTILIWDNTAVATRAKQRDDAKLIRAICTDLALPPIALSTWFTEPPLCAWLRRNLSPSITPARELTRLGMGAWSGDELTAFRAKLQATIENDSPLTSVIDDVAMLSLKFFNATWQQRSQALRGKARRKPAGT